MSVTAVPIQPIKKGSLLRYWFGIAVILLAAGGLAWLGTYSLRNEYATNKAFLASNAGNDGVKTTTSGLQYQIIRGGEGKSPTDEDVALISYKGTLRDGTIFDENPQAGLPVAGVVPGFSEALKLMQRGGKYKVWIPSDLGYGPEDQKNPQTGVVAIPGDSVLIFEVELLEFKSRAEVEAMQKQMQEMQKKQGGAGAMPGGPAGGVPQGLPPEIQAQLDAQMRQQGQVPPQ